MGLRSTLLAVGLACSAALPLSAATLTPVMTGLDNPRGLAIAPNGDLYVAEAGSGGDGPCRLLQGSSECYGATGGVSRLRKGIQERVLSGLPSLAAEGGAFSTGPHDVALQGSGNLAVTIGLGAPLEERESLGQLGGLFARLLETKPNNPKAEHSKYLVDFAGLEAALNPDGNPILESNPYGLLAYKGGQVVADAGANTLYSVAPNGRVSVLAVLPTPAGAPGDLVPTSVALGPDGAFYVGTLAGIVFRVATGQDPQVFLTGFGGTIDLDFGPDGSLYILQFGPAGLLTRVAPDGGQTVVASDGLEFPTSVLVDDRGRIFVSNFGVFSDIGEVVQVTP